MGGNEVKWYIFVNQYNFNKPEFNLAWIVLKYFRQLFHKKQILWLKLPDQSYLRIRLKSLSRFQQYSIVFFGFVWACCAQFLDEHYRSPFLCIWGFTNWDTPTYTWIYFYCITQVTQKTCKSYLYRYFILYVHRRDLVNIFYLIVVPYWLNLSKKNHYGDMDMCCNSPEFKQSPWEWRNLLLSKTPTYCIYKQ